MSFLTSHKTILLRALGGVLALAVVVSLVILFAEHGKSDRAIRGGSSQPDANLRYLTAETTENGIRLRFKFCSGTGDSAAPCSVPRYQAAVLPAPARLAVTFDALSYADYVIDGTPVDPSGLFFALFRAERTDGSSTLYFHLSDTVTVRAEETDELVLTLTRTDTPAQGAYFLLADAYYEYLTGTMPKANFTPTLCNDYAAVLMISAPYATEDKAESARDALLTDAWEGQSLRIVSLSAGA
ncbi:MAG: hypothetical protein J6X30_02615, partial [Clostridia bacterium]|nr:hypothetical protein [Clostridia bacterium]